MTASEPVPDAPQATPAELATRFERDAIPLLEPLFAGAMRLTGNKEDAQDLVQETMLCAYRGFHRFSDGTNVKAWLYRIMHNTWINQHRKRQRRPSEVLIDQVTDRSLDAGGVSCSSGLRPVEVAVLESLPNQEIRSALMTLQEQQRIAIFYADVEGLSYKEIALVMGTSVGTVMSRLHRGRQRLRTALVTVPADHGRIPSLDAG